MRRIPAACNAVLGLKHSCDWLLCGTQVLWQALKSGGIYVVEDLSENYIEKPFLDKGTFTEFMKTAIDIVQCR